MPQLGIESVLVAGRGPAACAVMASCARLGLKAVAVHSEAERAARHVRMADDAVLLGPAPAAESYLAVDRIVEAARRMGVSAVLPVPPALAGNARLAAAVTAAGLRWLGPDAEVLERLGGDGVEPASERGFLAWVSADGLRFPTPVARDRAAGIARVSWTPSDRTPADLPRAAERLAEIGWRGLVTVGIDPDGELAEVAAGFSLDIAVLERAYGVDAVELVLQSATGTGPPEGDVGPTPAAALAVQLRATLPPGTPGTVTGRLPGDRSWGSRSAAGTTRVVAVSGYDPGDRLDGWYDALLATVSVAAEDTAAAAAAAAAILADLPDTGVPHDGAEVSAVLDRLAAGRPVSGG